MEVQLIEGVEPDPSVETVMKKGAKIMQEFQPDWDRSDGRRIPNRCSEGNVDIL